MLIHAFFGSVCMTISVKEKNMVEGNAMCLLQKHPALRERGFLAGAACLEDSPGRKVVFKDVLMLVSLQN